MQLSDTAGSIGNCVLRETHEMHYLRGGGGGEVG